MAIKPSTGEGVLLPPHLYASQHPWTWTSIILSFGYILSLCPSQFRSGPISFLSFPELLLTLKDVPIHQLLIYSLFPLSYVQREELLDLPFWPSSDLSFAPYKTCQLTKQAQIQWTAKHESFASPLPYPLPPFIHSTVTSFPKSKLSFSILFSPGFWKAVSTHECKQYFKKV